MDDDVNATVRLLTLLGTRVIESHELPRAAGSTSRPAVLYFRSHSLVLLDSTLNERRRRQALDDVLAAVLGLTEGGRPPQHRRAHRGSR